MSYPKNIEKDEWIAIRNVAKALSLLAKEKIYSPIDAIGDSLSPALRVEALRRAIRMIASDKPEMLPKQYDIEKTISLLLDEKRGRLAGSILASLALASIHELEEKQQNNTAKTGGA